MTAPNHITETDSDGGRTRVTWPALPAERDEATGHAPSRDADIAALLEHLSELPDLPVALHEEVYAGLHDGLLAALNESNATASTATAAPGDATYEQA